MHREDRQDAEREVVNRKEGGFGAVHGAALILLFALVAAAPLVTARSGSIGFVLLYAAALGAWVVAGRASLSRSQVLLVAIVLRLALLLPQPQLSADAYRYLWDGAVARAGFSPYAHPPSDPRFAPLRSEWHSKMNHPEIRTIYPPVAQILFTAIPSLLFWRLLLLACDMAAISMLRNRAAVAYATFPLVLFEGIWSAHLDAIVGVMLLVAAIRMSAVGFAMAAALKLIPLAAAPAFFLADHRRTRWSLIVAAVLLIPFAAFATAGPVMPGFRDYATRWVFNSPAYSFALTIASHLPVKSLWTAVKDPLDLEAISPFIYAHIYPDFIARAILAVTIIGVIVWRRRSALDCIGALLLLSPTVHPWYWLTLVPLALEQRSAWLWIAAAAPFSYLLYDGAPLWSVWLLCYAAPLLFIWRLRTSESAS